MIQALATLHIRAFDFSSRNARLFVLPSSRIGACGWGQRRAHPSSLPSSQQLPRISHRNSGACTQRVSAAGALRTTPSAHAQHTNNGATHEPKQKCACCTSITAATAPMRCACVRYPLRVVTGAYAAYTQSAARKSTASATKVSTG